MNRKAVFFSTVLTVALSFAAFSFALAQTGTSVDVDDAVDVVNDQAKVHVGSDSVRVQTNGVDVKTGGVAIPTSSAQVKVAPKSGPNTVIFFVVAVLMGIATSGIYFLNNRQQQQRKASRKK